MNKFLTVIFLISVFIIGFLSVKDPDFGWHYRCGEDFLKGNYTICLKNNFSYFLPNYRAFNPSFIYDISLAFIFDRFGFLGISLLGSFIFVLAAVIFLQIVAAPLPLIFIGYFISFYLSEPVFLLGLRSQIITFLFFLISLYLYEKARKNMRYLLLFPLLLLIWVNTHIGFFIGLVVLTFAVFEKRFNKYWVFILILAFIATLVNPFGSNVYREIFNHATANLNTMIAEWVAPPTLESLIIVILSLVDLIVIFKRKKISFFQIFLLIFFTVLGLQARRNLAFFYPVFFYVLFKNLKLKSFNYVNNITLITGSALILIIFLALTLDLPTTFKFDTSWSNYCTDGAATYPCHALKTFPQLSGNVYATYEWGGFLIWQKPGVKVFVDGRMPAWHDENGKSPYEVYLTILQTKNGWNEKLQALKTNYLLITPGTFMGLLLENDSEKYGWKKIYEDQSAVIYKNQIE